MKKLIIETISRVFIPTQNDSAFVKTLKLIFNLLVIVLLLHQMFDPIYGKDSTEKVSELRGFVSDELKKPLTGARVEIVGTQWSTETDTHGEYFINRLSSLESNAVRLKISKNGYEIYSKVLKISNPCIYIESVLSRNGGKNESI